jgi:hypothetical protein
VTLPEHMTDRQDEGKRPGKAAKVTGGDRDPSLLCSASVSGVLPTEEELWWLSRGAVRQPNDVPLYALYGRRRWSTARRLLSGERGADEPMS